MDFAFIQGIIIGILVSIPMGPIGVLCVHRTLTKGQYAGLVSGFGAASADTFYAVIAVFGLSFVATFIRSNEFYLMLFGGIVLMGVGAMMFFKNTVKQYKKKGKEGNSNLLGDYFSTFGLTLTNPLTIIGIGTILAVYVQIKDEFYSMFILILGISTGALGYWVLLTQLVNAFRNKFNLRFLWYLNKIAGIAIFVFGILAVYNAFFPGLR